MARLFDDASSEYLEYAAAVVSAYPFAMAAWQYPDDGDCNNTSICIGYGSDFDNYWELYLRNDDKAFSFYTHVSGGYAHCLTANTFSVNTWNHVCAIGARKNDRRSILNGDIANKGTESTNLTPSVNRTTIGARNRNGNHDLFASGRLAEVAIWDLTNWPGAAVADKADEFERLAVPALADGFSPRFFPLGLVGYWPLGGVYDANDGDHCVVDRTYDMTAYNTPSTADHPPIIYPRRPQIFPAAAAGDVTITPNVLSAASGLQGAPPNVNRTLELTH